MTSMFRGSGESLDNLAGELLCIAIVEFTFIREHREIVQNKR